MVIPAAGLGTRLLPATKEIPKEMLPIAVATASRILFKPTLQVIYEQLFDAGLREFCFVVGRGKRAIEDHFAPDWPFTQKLPPSAWRTDLEGFFKRLEESRIYFVNQPQRLGFGDAVLRSEDFVKEDSFLVHAGDDLVMSRGSRHVKELERVIDHEGADGVVLVEEVRDPSNYGVVVGEPVSQGLLLIKGIEEKPKAPKSHLAVVAIYALTPHIFEAIRACKKDTSGELQLTSAILRMIQEGKRFYAVKLTAAESRLDIGNPESYLKALNTAARGPR